MIHQLRDFGIGIDQSLGKFFGMTGDIANALNAIEFGDVLDQEREISNLAVTHDTAIGIHILPEQRDLSHALGGKVCDLGQDIVKAARNFLAAGIGHDAVATVFAAALHDRDIGACAFDLGGW